MGCRLNDFDIADWLTTEVDGHKVEYARARAKPIRYRGKVYDHNLRGMVYKLDGVFQGFTGCEDFERSRDAVMWHVERTLKGQP